MSPADPTHASPRRVFALAAVALVFMLVLAAIVAPVIGDKLSEDRAAAAGQEPVNEPGHVAAPAAVAGDPRAGNGTPGMPQLPGRP